MKKLDKVILILYYNDCNGDVMVFENQNSYRKFIDTHLDEFNSRGLKKFELYFGYLAQKG